MVFSHTINKIYFINSMKEVLILVLLLAYPLKPWVLRGKIKP